MKCLSNTHKAWLKLAIKIATTSECRNKHGSVIVSRGRVLSTGKNTFRNHPKFIHDFSNCSLHAEVAAIRLYEYRNSRPYGYKYPRDQTLRNATLYVARVNRQGIVRLSKPCSNCEEVIREVGIRRVIWTTN